MASKVHEFSKDEQDLLVSFANQAAIAFEDLLGRQGLESLVKLGEAISGKTLSGMKSVLERSSRDSICHSRGRTPQPSIPTTLTGNFSMIWDNVVIYPPDLSLTLRSKPRERGSGGQGETTR